MNYKKNKYIEDELWILTLNAALSRGARVYKKGTKQKNKKEFKNALKNYFDKKKDNNIIEQYYENEVDEKQHVENIKRICENTKDEYDDIIKGGKLNIGRAQKLLNLYLKYLWCLGEIAEPPHCPIDRKIIKKVESGSNITSWTNMKEINQYEDLIEKIRKKAKEKNLSIAEWELKEYSRN